jgi:signal transduction histidine kinase
VNVKGIPQEYENIIFEPFFRMVNNVYEKYDTIDYGLGLTIVEKIIRKHNGEVSVTNVKDNSDFSRDPVTKVSFTIKIPLVISNGEAK